jgi:hypothetical protein
MNLAKVTQRKMTETSGNSSEALIPPFKHERVFS